MPVEPPLDICTADEIAALFKTSQKHIWSLATREENPMPSFLLGRFRRFVRDDVIEWAVTKDQYLADGQPVRVHQRTEPATRNGRVRAAQRRARAAS